jgi:hypothetical protein
LPRALSPLLEEALSAWRERELGASPHAVLVGRRESIRHGGHGAMPVAVV